VPHDSSLHPLRPLRRCVRAATLWLLGIVLLLPGIVQGQGAIPVEPDPTVRGLLERIEEERGIDEEALLDALLAAGPVVEQRFLDYVALPAPERAFTLDAALEGSLRSQLGRLPRLVRTRIADGESEGQRECLLALRTLERFGAATDVALLFGLASPADPELPFDSRLASQLEHSLAAILSRDVSAWAGLTRTFPALDERVTLIVLRAVSEAASPQAMDFLGELLGKDAGQDVIVLAQLGRVVEFVRAAPSQRTLDYVHESLESMDPQVRREACLVVGRLEDSQAVALVIELLADEDPLVAENAYWALKRITRESLSDDIDRWRLWYDRELAWWQTEASDLLTALHGEEIAEVAAALRGLVGHGLFRHELAAEVAVELRHPNGAIVAQACAVLGVLRSRGVTDELQQLLEAASESVRPHAEAALARIRD